MALRKECLPLNRRSRSYAPREWVGAVRNHLTSGSEFSEFLQGVGMVPHYMALSITYNKIALKALDFFTIAFV